MQLKWPKALQNSTNIFASTCKHRVCARRYQCPGNTYARAPSTVCLSNQSSSPASSTFNMRRVELICPPPAPLDRSNGVVCHMPGIITEADASWRSKTHVDVYLEEAMQDELPTPIRVESCKVRPVPPQDATVIRGLTDLMDLKLKEGAIEVKIGTTYHLGCIGSTEQQQVAVLLAGTLNIRQEVALSDMRRAVQYCPESPDLWQPVELPVVVKHALRAVQGRETKLVIQGDKGPCFRYGAIKEVPAGQQPCKHDCWYTIPTCNPPMSGSTAQVAMFRHFKSGRKELVPHNVISPLQIVPALLADMAAALKGETAAGHRLRIGNIPTCMHAEVVGYVGLSPYMDQLNAAATSLAAFI